MTTNEKKESDKKNLDLSKYGNECKEFDERVLIIIRHVIVNILTLMLNGD